MRSTRRLVMAQLLIVLLAVTAPIWASLRPVHASHGIVVSVHELASQAEIGRASCRERVSECV